VGSAHPALSTCKLLRLAPAPSPWQGQGWGDALSVAEVWGKSIPIVPIENEFAPLQTSYSCHVERAGSAHPTALQLKLVRPRGVVGAASPQGDNQRRVYFKCRTAYVI
jgi:hypothetical protein